MKQAIIYWIRLPEHTDVLTEGYVGVTQNFKRRINEHYRDIKNGKHANPHLVNVVDKYGWDNLIKEVIFSGEEHICYLRENEIRPTEKTGWNLSRGGHRGPGRKKGSPGKIRTAEEQLLFENQKKRKEEQKLRKIKSREERSKIRPICSTCNEIPVRPNGISVRGYQMWGKFCNTCHRKKYDKKNKEDSCTRCGFVAIDSCQLCYVDGETVCHNCNAIELKKKRRHKELTVDATVDWNNLRL